MVFVLHEILKNALSAHSARCEDPVKAPDQRDGTRVD